MNTKRGNWPERMICKRRGHIEKAYRIYRVMGGGSMGVLEPHCSRCQKTLPGAVMMEPPAAPHVALRPVANTPEPGGLPPASFGVMEEDARAGDALEVNLETGRIRVSRSMCDRPFP